MMRRIELLPDSYRAQRRQRRAVAGVVVAGLVVLVLLLAYWLTLGTQIASSENELAQVRTRNSALESEIAPLQQFSALEAEANAKEGALATVMEGDVDWPSVLAEIAMNLPSEIWLTNLVASAGQTEGATAVGTESAPVRINDEQPFGRIAFTGRSLSMPGVSRWLVRLGSAPEFEALWLNSATESEIEEGVVVVDFDSTLELDDEAGSRRFQDGLP